MRYPIGQWKKRGFYEDHHRQSAIKLIRELPDKLASRVQQWTAEQLDTPYRPEGWTVRQLIHHVADSHMNSYIRFKWALTEDVPLIKPYDQDSWGELPDTAMNIEVSLKILKGLHERWVVLLESFSDREFNLALRHPAWDDPVTLDMMLSMYAWHGEHHYEQINRLGQRQGWN